VNGRVLDRPGHDSERACPHGVYATRGIERYVAIATETTAQWRSLAERVPALAGLRTDALDDLDARIARRAEIDAALTRWCAEQEPFALAESLRRAGVPAYVVMRGTDLHVDPQLLARDFFVDLDHPAIGRVRVNGPVTKFSGTPAAPTHAGPTIGQHTFEVLTGMLGYDEDQVAELAASGALT
jgi:crotonobetainyl-CoA:carnitine CoA-transferase CaiB-like acyl-CoA transferase